MTDSLSSTEIQAYEAGRAAWPTVELAPQVFVAFAREKGDLPSDPVRQQELFLAAACAERVSAALDVFEAQFVSRVDASLIKVGLDRDQIAEVKQQLRIKLIVNVPPAIAEYSGRGSLEGWVRVAASRTALNLRRATHRETALDDEMTSLVRATTASPELEHLRDRYRDELTEALVESFRALMPRDRSLIRLHYAHGLLIHDLAAAFHVHRNTAATWLERARGTWIAKLQRALRRRFGEDDRDIGELVGLIRSRLDVSLGTLLATRPAVSSEGSR